MNGQYNVVLQCSLHKTVSELKDFILEIPNVIYESVVLMHIIYAMVT